MSGPLRSTVPLLRRFVRGGGGLARKGNAGLHPKHGPRFHSKGYGARSMGRRTRRGGFMVDWERRVPEYVVPDMEGCELKPYVSAHTPKIKVPPPPMVW